MSVVIGNHLSLLVNGNPKKLGLKTGIKFVCRIVDWENLYHYGSSRWLGGIPHGGTPSREGETWIKKMGYR